VSPGSGWHLFGALLGLAIPTRDGEAQDHIYFAVECTGGLQTASGVIGPKHSYGFQGQCVLWQMRQPEDTDEMKALLEDGETAWHDKRLVTFNAQGKASWDRASGASKESLEFQGPVAGKLVRSGTCMKDPFLEASPVCGAVSGSQQITAGPHLERLTTALVQHRFFLFWKQFSAGEAQALSAAQGKNSVPPPPEPISPPVIAGIAVNRIMIGRDEHVVRVTIRGAKPITAALRRGRGSSSPIVLEDPAPGASQRSAALRISPSMVRQPGVLTILLQNKHGRAQTDLLACAPGGSGNPKGCPVRLKAGTTRLRPTVPVPDSAPRR
jgi:hypothetical protein